MPKNIQNELPYYERVSIHEAVKFQQLAKRLQKIDTSEVTNILTEEGEKWYVEIAFKDNKKLMISNDLPSFVQENTRGKPYDRNELYFGIINP